MNLQTAITYTENYFIEKEFFKVKQGIWTNTFIEVELMQDGRNEEMYFLQVENIEISKFTIALFLIPESESDYHNILSLLKIL